MNDAGIHTETQIMLPGYNVGLLQFLQQSWKQKKNFLFFFYCFISGTSGASQQAEPLELFSAVKNVMVVTPV